MKLQPRSRPCSREVDRYAAAIAIELAPCRPSRNWYRYVAFLWHFIPRKRCWLSTKYKINEYQFRKMVRYPIRDIFIAFYRYSANKVYFEEKLLMRISISCKIMWGSWKSILYYEFLKNLTFFKKEVKWKCVQKIEIIWLRQIGKKIWSIFEYRRYFCRELIINKLIVASLRYFIMRCAIRLECSKIILYAMKNMRVISC